MECVVPTSKLAASLSLDIIGCTNTTNLFCWNSAKFLQYLCKCIAVFMQRTFKEFVLLMWVYFREFFSLISTPNEDKLIRLGSLMNCDCLVMLSFPKVWFKNVFSGGDFDRLNDVQCQHSCHCTSFNLSKSPPEDTFLDQIFWGINPSAYLHQVKNL